MAVRRLGIIMYGVTGRMGINQHLVALDRRHPRRRAASHCANGDRVMPDPILVGRNAEKLGRWRRRTASRDATTDLDAALADPDDTVFFDAGHHADARRLLGKRDRAPASTSIAKSRSPTDLDRRRRRAAGEGAGSQARRGAGQAVPARPAQAEAAARRRLLRPDVRGARRVRLLGVRGRLGSRRSGPVWNYRKAEGGGIILDMLCHWRYVLDNLFGKVKAVRCLGATHIPRARRRKGQGLQGRRRRCGLRDVPARGRRHRAYQFVLGDRVRRDDLVTFQVDGTHGSAVAGLHEMLHAVAWKTPQPVWNPDVPQTIELLRAMDEVPDTMPTRTASRSNGKTSSVTSPTDTPWHMASSRGPRACSLRSSGCKAGRSGAGSTCRN